MAETAAGPAAGGPAGDGPTGSDPAAEGQAAEGPAAGAAAGPRDPARIAVVGIGGSVRVGSQSEYALRLVLDGAAKAGAATQVITGKGLLLPFYDVDSRERSEAARELLAVLAAADGVVLSSPGYHGGLSGLVKNALDYVEDLKSASPAYLGGRAVGTVAVAYGWQAAVTTLNQLRTTVHALRGWPTPLGGAVNSIETTFDGPGGSNDPKVDAALRTIGEQVVDFARRS